MNIQLKNISKSYGDLAVLRNFNMDFSEHKTTCIMGPSGVGKTTLIHILMGLEKADSGSIEGIIGKKITAVFQEDRLCEQITGIKNVQMVCNNRVSENKIKEEFQRVGLTEYNRPVAELSGGMKRRVAIVRALLPESDIIIMDEPFKGLDDELKEQVIDYVKQKTMGKTVIIVTHDKEEVSALSAYLVTL